MQKVKSETTGQKHTKPHGNTKPIRFEELDTGCHVCVSHARSVEGYSNITISGKPARLHRVIYELHNGEIPRGMYVCHTCDNPPCCNPNHLFLGTPKENTDDMDVKGRRCRGVNHPNSKLTDEDVGVIKSMLGSISESKIAEIFGVDRSLINLIRHNKAWRHLEPKQSNRTLDLSVPNDGNSIDHQPNNTGGNPFVLRLLTKSCSKLFSKLTSGLFRSNQTTQEPKLTM